MLGYIVRRGNVDEQSNFRKTIDFVVWSVSSDSSLVGIISLAVLQYCHTWYLKTKKECWKVT